MDKDEAKAVASHLIGNIQRCFSKKSKNPRTARDTLWKNYFQLRSSDAYKSFWKKALLDSIRGNACPMFYQYIADYIIEHLVGIHFPVGMRTQSESLTKQLDFEDVSALRYTAGSVIRSLRDKTERSAQPQKKELASYFSAWLKCWKNLVRMRDCFSYVYIITI